MYNLTPADKATVDRHSGPLSHDLETILKLYEKTRKIVEIANSRIHGQGYHALRDVAGGEWVMSAFGVFIGHQSEQHSIQQSLEVHIEPFEYGGKYLNHSCDGNLVVHSDERGITGFYAKRSIQRGEEITYYYPLSEFKWAENSSETDTQCNCQTSKCESFINSFNMLAPAQQRELIELGIVSQYLVDWFKDQQRLNPLYGKNH